MSNKRQAPLGTGEIETARPRRRGAHPVSIERTAVGKGIFARRRYRADDTIGEILGDVIDSAEYGSDYCFRIGDELFLEPSPPFRYVNHCCDPNCEFDWFDVSEPGESQRKRRVFLFALRDIQPGEELTIDYNWSAAAAIPCRCHSPNCRGWIVDLDQVKSIAGDGNPLPVESTGGVAGD